MRARWCLAVAKTSPSPTAASRFVVPPDELLPVQQTYNQHAQKEGKVVLCALYVNVLDVRLVASEASALWQVRGAWEAMPGAVAVTEFSNSHVVNGVEPGVAASYAVLCTAAEWAQGKAPTITLPVLVLEVPGHGRVRVSAGLKKLLRRTLLSDGTVRKHTDSGSFSYRDGCAKHAGKVVPHRRWVPPTKAAVLAGAAELTMHVQASPWLRVTSDTFGSALKHPQLVQLADAVLGASRLRGAV